MATIFTGTTIQTITIASNGDLCSFTSIPTGYDRIEIDWSAKSNSGGAVNLTLEANADAGSNYYRQVNQVQSGSPDITQSADNRIGAMSGNGAGAQSSGSIIIRDYDNTTDPKVFIGESRNARSSSSNDITFYTTTWNTTSAAVNRIDIIGGSGYKAGSVFKMVGYKDTTIGGGSGALFMMGWTYDATVAAAADPGAFKYRFDSATMGSITKMYLHDSDLAGLDESDWIDGWYVGQHLRQGQSDDGTVGAIFKVTGAPVDNTGWWTIPMAHVANGTSGIADTEDYAFQLQGGVPARKREPETTSFTLTAAMANQYLYVDAVGFELIITIPLKATEDLARMSFVIKQVGGAGGSIIRIRTANSSMTLNDVTGSIQTRTLVGDQSTVVVNWSEDDKFYVTGSYDAP